MSRVYLDTDVLLALLKAEDWLQSAADAATFESPKTSVVTAIEIQLVMFETWSRSELAGVGERIETEGIELLSLTPEAIQAGSALLPTYSGLNVFDAVHLGHAITLDEPIVSTDTLYPKIDEVDNLDPREL